MGFSGGKLAGKNGGKKETTRKSSRCDVHFHQFEIFEIPPNPSWVTVVEAEFLRDRNPTLDGNKTLTIDGNKTPICAVQIFHDKPLL